MSDRTLGLLMIAGTCLVVMIYLKAILYWLRSVREYGFIFLDLIFLCCFYGIAYLLYQAFLIAYGVYWSIY